MVPAGAHHTIVPTSMSVTPHCCHHRPSLFYTQQTQGKPIRPTELGQAAGRRGSNRLVGMAEDAAASSIPSEAGEAALEAGKAFEIDGSNSPLPRALGDKEDGDYSYGRCGELLRRRSSLTRPALPYPCRRPPAARRCTHGHRKPIVWR